MTDQSPLRLAMLGILVLGLFTSLFARLWYLQVAAEQRIEAQTTAQRNLYRTVYTSAPRGRVIDRHGNVLIDNRLVNEVVIDKFSLNESLPRESQQREFAIKLAREISEAGFLIKAIDIEDALNDARYGPFEVVPIAKDVPERFSILIGEREDDFPGVEVRKTNVRFYPYGQRAAHLLGYVGAVDAETFEQVRDLPKLYQPTDEIGIAGVEASFEDILRGTPQVELIEVDAGGNRIALINKTEAIPGNDVRLTIDINLQALVEKELAEGIRDARNRVDETDEENPVPYNAPGGAMVLLDPDGSRVLAMASYPAYDQRIFLNGISQRDFGLLRDDENAPLLDRASAAAYAPGSTFKLITAYAALDTGLLGDRGFLKRGQFLVDEGVWRLPGECVGTGCTIENAGQKPLGAVDLELAITESSNVFFGQLGFQFDVRQGFQATQLIEVAEDFGYGLKYSAVPGARAGSLPEPQTAGETANMAVGQGRITSSPLQIANSYAAIANGGSVYSPMLAESVIDAVTEEVLIDYQPRLIHELYMPDEYYQPLIRGMAGVTTSEDGTAYEAFENFPLLRFEVFGKTGTVENPPKQDNAAFAAFGPWPNPQYSAVVYIEQAGLGGEAAAPVVARVFERIATGDIDIVPTEAEADDLISEAEALAVEEERLRSEADAAAAEIAAQEAAALAAAGEDDPAVFTILVPGADDDDVARADEGRAERDGAERDGAERDGADTDADAGGTAEPDSGIDENEESPAQDTSDGERGP